MKKIPSLRSEIMLIFLVVTVPVILVLGLVLSTVGMGMIQDVVAAETREASNFLDYTVSRFQEDALGNFETIRNVLSEQVANPKASAPLDPFRSTLRSLFPLVHSIQLADSRGRIVDTMPASRDLLGNDISLQPYFSSGRFSYHWSDSFTASEGGQSTVSLSGPVGPYICILFLDLLPLQENLQKINVPGKAQLSITDRFGTIIADSNATLVEQREKSPWFAYPEGEAMTVQDPKEGPLLLWVRYLGDSGWVMHKTMKYWDVWTPIVRFGLFMALMLTGAIVLVMVLLWYRVGGLTRHLESFTLASVLVGRGTYQKISPPDHPQEFAFLGNTFNTMVDSLAEREAAINELNKSLEGRVLDRTNELQVRNEELTRTLHSLKQTQDQLIQSERLAALGHLVAGVAHEINTPLGVAITAASFLEIETNALRKASSEGTLSQKSFLEGLGRIDESGTMINRNLERAADLVRNFKQLATDQNLDEARTFDLPEHLIHVLESLKPAWKHRSITLETDFPAKLKCHTHPGALAQVITNLVMNSLDHGFSATQQGTITLTLSRSIDGMDLVYADNGQGMDEETARRLYEPFFTTKRDAGNSGLGMNIVYNLVSSKLHGSISLESSPGQGVRFFMHIPLEILE